MSICASLLAASAIAGGLVAPEVRHFPSEYFDTEAKASLQRRAMEKWPDPSQILDRWRSGALKPRDKIAVLLGMAASHDPVVLPLYREALGSANGKLRVAAAYGYRDLLGDARPNLSRGVDLAAGQQLAREVEAVEATLRQRSLVEFWIQATLAADGGSLPGWSGVILRRPPGICLNALEQIIVLEDFRLLATAYQLAESQTVRLGLLRLLEAVTLQEFFSPPTDGRTGWGYRDMDEAFDAADLFVETWLDRRCVWDPKRVLTGTMAEMGVRGVDPLAPISWDFWVAMLRTGNAGWRMMAARRLHQLGGRWSDLSIGRSEGERQIELREEIAAYYGLIPTTSRGSSDGRHPF